MAFVNPPNQTDFTTFLRSVVGINVVYLPDNSVDITNAFTIAMSWASTRMALMPGNLYSLAVYNLGADFVISYAQDQTGQTYFFDLRKNLGISLFVPGVLTSSSDTSTSQSILNPEIFKNLTFGDLQNLKTIYGRAYLNIAQQQGTLWGIS